MRNEESERNRKGLPYPMPSIQIIRPSDDPPHATAEAIQALGRLVWPPEPGATIRPIENTLASWKAGKITHFFVMDANGLALAHSAISPREIETAQGPLTVGALAGVCVHPDHRGLNLGAEVVRAAFGFLPELDIAVALFQTGVPKFYEKLGCRLVANEFRNGDHPGNPFWDAYAMIYPAAFAWPEGPVDLKGPGY